MVAEKDESGVVGFFDLEAYHQQLELDNRIEKLDGLYHRYCAEAIALKAKLANGSRKCWETKQSRLTDIETRLLPQTQLKIESLQRLKSGGPP